MHCIENVIVFADAASREQQERGSECFKHTFISFFG